MLCEYIDSDVFCEQNIGDGQKIEKSNRKTL